MNEHLLTNTLNQLAEEGIPDDLNLRAAIRNRLETSKTQPHRGVFSMRASFSQPQRIAALIVITVLLLTAAFLITPQGRAWAKQLFQFFSLADGDSFPIPTEQVFSITATATQIPTKPLSSVEGVFATVPEAETATKIDILEFHFPLPGLMLDRVNVNSESVSLVYEAIGGGGYLTLEQRFGDFSDSQWQSVPQDSIEIVQIGDIEGEYIGGFFTTQDGETANWTSDTPVTRLRWQDGERWLGLTKEGDPVPMEYLDRDNMIALAHSLVDPSVKLNIQSGIFIFKNGADAEALVGFDIAEPGYLPGGAKLYWVNVSMPQKWVSLEYQVVRNASFSISQVPKMDLSQLDQTPYMPTYSLEIVQIGPYSGWYVTDESNFQAIWWPGSQNAFAIYFDAQPDSTLQFNQADLIAIAESLR